jgi:hypothetical protein
MNVEWRCLRLTIPILAATVALLFVSPAQAQGLHTLTGESLIAHPETGGTSEVVGVCNPSGTSTFTFSVSGRVASGPYPGTFSESGTLTLGPFVTQPDGFVVATPISFESSFTITSPMATITGSKTLSSEPLTPYNTGACGEILTPFGFPSLPPNAISIQARVDYTAQIVIANNHATFLDSGSAFLDYGDLGVRDVPFGPFRFVEIFESDRPAPTPAPRVARPASG